MISRFFDMGNDRERPTLIGSEYTASYFFRTSFGILSGASHSFLEETAVLSKLEDDPSRDEYPAEYLSATD